MPGESGNGIKKKHESDREYYVKLVDDNHYIGRIDSSAIEGLKGVDIDQISDFEQCLFSGHNDTCWSCSMELSNGTCLTHRNLGGYIRMRIPGMANLLEVPVQRIARLIVHH